MLVNPPRTRTNNNFYSRSRSSMLRTPQQNNISYCTTYMNHSPQSPVKTTWIIKVCHSHACVFYAMHSWLQKYDAKIRALSSPNQVSYDVTAKEEGSRGPGHCRMVTRTPTKPPHRATRMQMQPRRMAGAGAPIHTPWAPSSPKCVKYIEEWIH